ncbi:hypothetical protein [Streptomyces avermitilis]|uniref:hypothetical protein n=1 Tax=Streptomyces avermitilis TaxID=33903 RepID=UPI00339E6253
MRTSIRIASVLAGLPLAPDGVAFTAPAAHADVTACINHVERELQGGEGAQQYEERREPNHPATTVRTWTDAFAWSVISGLIGEPHRVTG